jgi:PD-(D/E)XK endonuclease
MPVRNAEIKQTTLAAHKQLSFENLLAAWLLGDGWEVLIPAIDHGRKTDLVVADDDLFYRIQVKSLQTDNDNISVENKWSGAKINYVVYFSVTGDWGYIAPAFSEERRPLNDPEHIRFQKNSTAFLEAFSKA